MNSLCYDLPLLIPSWRPYAESAAAGGQVLMANANFDWRVATWFGITVFFLAASSVLLIALLITKELLQFFRNQAVDRGYGKWVRPDGKKCRVFIWIDPDWYRDKKEGVEE